METIYQKEIHQMQKEMGTLNGKMDKVLEVLKGNDLDKKDEGMVGDVRQLKQRVAKLERWKDRVVYALIGASFGAGWTISDLITKFFTHK